ncbi:unnamed protein product, partial [Mesorhabditis belari]|uniref:EGF-like domain-containing protein n=1 Tax=Mesorhabditis belari TaxID=2138241 RepID=A0AAF3J3X0_9BILA
MEGSCVCNNGTYNSTVVQIPAVSSTLGTNYQACAIANNPCTSKPCPANSNCIRSNVNYRCTCWANFTGASCNISLPTGVCASSPCQNGATCDDNGDGTFNCTCAANYMGELCENFNYCSNNNQCWNGGKCLLLFSGEDLFVKANFVTLFPFQLLQLYFCLARETMWHSDSDTSIFQLLTHRLAAGQLQQRIRKGSTMQIALQPVVSHFQHLGVAVPFSNNKLSTMLH